MDNRRVANEGKTISNALSWQMLMLCGQDMISLKGEIEKLSAYTEGDTIIDKDIRHVVSNHWKITCFLLHDYLIRRDYQMRCRYIGTS